MTNPPADFQNLLTEAVEQNIETQRKMLAACQDDLHKIAQAFVDCLQNGHKILLMGNGGSAADAQHVAGEFIGRFLKERRALPAIALTADSSVSTCIANDYCFEDIFARQVQALANAGDIVVGISTSGNSENVLRAMKEAQINGAITIGFTGETGGKLKAQTDLCLCVPSKVTARVQEAHITVWHVICGYVEDRLFKPNDSG